MKTSIALASFVATAFLSFAIPVNAGKTMSAEELKARISGKTADGYNHKKDFAYKNYFNPDGTMIRRAADGYVTKAKWRIKDNGAQYIQYEGSEKERCGPFVDNGDGSISKFRKGNKVVALKNFVDGNQIK